VETLTVVDEIKRIMGLEDPAERYNAVRDFLITRCYWKNFDKNTRDYIAMILPEIIRVLMSFNPLLSEVHLQSMLSRQLEVDESEPIIHKITCETYEPLIQGSIDDLESCLRELSSKSPRTAELFLKILQVPRKKKFSLEDWLTVGPFLIVWKKRFESLNWFENLFAVVSSEIWKSWVDEVVKQTSNNISGPYAIGNIIYSYLLHIYAANWAIKEGFTSIEFPDQQKGVGDITAVCGDRKIVIECKFVHMSKKFESYCSRVISVFCQRTNNPLILLVDQFSFPPSEKIKTIEQDECIAIKEFVKQVAKDPGKSHHGIFKNLVFEYRPELPLALVTIDSQQKDTRRNALNFLEKGLTKILVNGAKQLTRIKDSNCQKILFLGLQSDFEYLIDWNVPVLQEIKTSFFSKAANERDIKVIYSEDVGFSVARYL
jgi:hypothetical protein